MDNYLHNTGWGERAGTDSHEPDRKLAVLYAGADHAEGWLHQECLLHYNPIVGQCEGWHAHTHRKGHQQFSVQQVPDMQCQLRAGVPPALGSS